MSRRCPNHRAFERFVVWTAPLMLFAACGKEGPPLPPLVRVPAPPTELAAERRGDSVDIRLVVPSANTDGSRPANVERVEVYAITAPGSVTDDQFVKLGTLVGSVEVKAPRDPDATVDPDEPVSDVEPPQGPGLDQGARATLQEAITAGALAAVDLTTSTSRTTTDSRHAAPLAGPPLAPASRVYAGVGVNTSGRRGPFSGRVGAPLASAPQPLPSLEATYDETTITVRWEGLPPARPVQEPAVGDVLSARLIGLSFPTTAYNVYDVTDDAETRLTDPAIATATYEDTRLEWGTERCYRVRVVRAYERSAIESEGSPLVCVTPADTFAPKPPANLQVVPSAGAISLIWQRGGESDLAGFIVLRGAGPEALTPVTPAAIQETSFTDTVAPGVRYVYAVQAVDKAGNRSEPSSPSEIVEAR